jgi:Asp-tRNA(Asn)/Glu-tRNA(Gln) amidotransferase A subunit family amidase
MTVATPGRTDEVRGRIAAHAHLNAFVSLTDEPVEDGRVLAVKDLLDVRGTVTTGGSIVPDAVPAERDAEAVARLRAAGWSVVGKTNLHEWGLGPTSGNPHYGAVRNPADPERIAGGSSGGSAAAVAAGLCDLALGTDTGGSIRIPSSLCGTTGIRPTYGTVSVDGVAALGHSFDTVGPMARDVQTVADALRVLGVDGAGEVDVPDPDAVRLGVPLGWVQDVDEETAHTWAAVSRGVPLVTAPARDAFTEPGLTILYVEAAANHAEQLALRPDTLGADVRELMRHGASLTAVDYVRAQRARAGLRAGLDAALEGLDALLLPATACVAPLVDADPIEVRYRLTCFTRPFGVTGHPVVALPGPAPGLPVGLQLVGHRGQDARLLAVAASLEAAWREGTP